MTQPNTDNTPKDPQLETTDCLRARLIELDLLEQALNQERDIAAFKLQRLEDLQARLKKAESSPTDNTESNADRGLEEKLKQILTKNWLLNSSIWCSDSTGKKKETVKFPPQPLKVGPSDKVLADLQLLIKQSNLALLSRIDNEVIGSNELKGGAGESFRDHHRRSARNQMRKRLRRALDTIKAEIEGSTE